MKFELMLKARPGQIAHPMSIGRAQVHKPLRRARFFGLVNFALKKKKKWLDLQIYSQIDKTVNKL